ncbi:MAG: replication and repair protein RecF [Candidatus Sumerlaeota bacterium]|nr:replication and repair protein RecF [Candidatus Sumerlaeota bacterium]
MPLLSLRLENFRLVGRANIELAPGINLFWGDNAQGKTTVLEAAGMLATGRSFRTARDRECIGWGAGEQRVGAVEGVFTAGPSRHEVRVAIEPSRKAVWLDRKPLRALSELWGLFRTVFFVPADLGLIQGPPQQRRAALDTLLSQSQPAYLQTLVGMTRALASRNGLLRRHVPPTDPQYDAFEKTLAVSAARTMLARARLAERLTEATRVTMAEITGGTEELALVYEAGFGTASGIGALCAAGTPADELAAELLALWRRARKGDLERGVTREGPHRDDLRFEIGGHDARSYASQGQTRSAVLALRLAELDLLAGLDPGRPPVLLLDDILGELDAGRAERFLNLVAKRQVQTLMTATGAAIVEATLPVERRFCLEKGNVTPDRETPGADRSGGQ